jgi:hypothetical protein
MPAGALECQGLFLVADDGDNLRVNRSYFDRVDDGLKIGPAPGCQHSDSQ